MWFLIFIVVFVIVFTIGYYKKSTNICNNQHSHDIYNNPDFTDVEIDNDYMQRQKEEQDEETPLKGGDED